MLPWFIVSTEVGSAPALGRPKPYLRHPESGTSDLEDAQDLARRWTQVDRVIPVLPEQDRPWWEPLLARVPAKNLVEEPFDRGSACGILVAASRIHLQDPWAPVVAVSISGGREWSVQLPQPADFDQVPMSGNGLRVHGRTAFGTASAFLDCIRHGQPELYHRFVDRGGPNLAIWDLANVYPFLDYADFWDDVVPRVQPELDVSLLRRAPATSAEPALRS